MIQTNSSRRPSRIDVLDSLEAAAYCRPGPGSPPLWRTRVCSSFEVFSGLITTETYTNRRSGLSLSNLGRTIPPPSSALDVGIAPGSRSRGKSASSNSLRWLREALRPWVKECELARLPFERLCSYSCGFAGWDPAGWHPYEELGWPGIRR